MKYTKKNWIETLEGLGFTEQKNEKFGGMTVFNDKGVPCWNYITKEEKEKLYIFFNGAIYWKVHEMFK